MRSYQRRVANGEVELNVTEWNRKSPITVVLVHGYPDSSYIWHRCAQQLARQYHVVAYDVRGAGKSDAPKDTTSYRMAYLSADFRAVIDAVSPDRPVHLVGHDWGSIQSWESVTDPDLAHRIASYTSISGPCLDHVGQWMSQRLKSAKPKALAQLVKQLRQSWYIGAFHLPWLAPMLWKSGLDKAWPKLLRHTDGVSEDETNPNQRSDGATGIRLYRANMLNRLERPKDKYTDVPVQLVVPLNDPFVSPALTDDLHQWASRLWRIEANSGHWLPLSHPQWLADKLTRFIDFIESGVDDAQAPPGLRRRQVHTPRQPLSGKLAVVTGAGNGIGRETLVALAAQGAEVIAVDIDPEALAHSVQLAEHLGASAQSECWDVSDLANWQRLADRLAAEDNCPDIVVNNAGIGMAGPFLDTEHEDWEKILGVNLWSVINGSRLFARQMVDQAVAGTIVNVASAAAFSPTRSMSAYSTTKAAVRMLSDCMRADLSNQGVRVVTVCPGFVNSGITDRATFVGETAEGQQQKRKRATSLYAKRNLTPDAVADAIIGALLSPQDEVLIGSEAYGFNWLGRLSPALSRRIARLDLAG